MNTIAIHAADVWGNVMTTNLNVVLDYSGDTNPPALTIEWPPDGTVIGGSSFTLQAQVDDITATVTASVNGQTNTGIVQRNGQVRGLTLPLAAGTNIVTVTATDAAGNSMATNLTLVQSATMVTIDPISSDQLNQSSVNVTGTVSDTNATVTVNGVSATVDGSGNWSANDVPVSETGVATIEAVASDPTNDPVQDLVQPQPPVLEVQSMHEYQLLWEDEHIIGNNNNESCWIPFIEVQYEESWVNGIGGEYSDEQQSSSGCGNPVQTSTSTGLDSTNYYTYSDSYTCANDSETATISSAGDLATVNWDESYHLTVDSGGEGQPGTVQTFLVSAGAKYQNSYNGSFYHVPPQTMSILGQRLQNSGIGNGDGETNGVAIVSIPAGASIPNFMPSAPYKIFYPQIQQTNVLQIIDNNTGSNLSAQVNTVIVGQQMNLSCQLTITNAALNDSMLTNFQWTVPGYAISNYVANTQSGTLYTNFPTTNSSVAFYWVDGATNRTLLCAATIGGVTVSNWAIFNVMRPMAQFSAQTIGAIAADTNYHSFQFSPLDGSIIDGGLDPAGTNWLHFGVDTSWANVGIAFAFSNAPSIPFGFGTTYGKYFIVQLINSSDVKKNVQDGASLNGQELVRYGLDIDYPYESSNDDWHIDGYSTKADDMWFDSPSSSLDRTTWLSRTDSFTTYLMFLDGYPHYTYTNNIPIPMYSFTWSWSGTAITNGGPNGYSVSSHSISLNPVSQTSSFPIWNTNAAYFLYQTNLVPFNEN